VLWSLGLLCALAIAALTKLGIWQLERRVWKLNLIEQIEHRVNAAPVSAPGPAQWPRITADRDAYRRVRVAGQFLNEREILVQAVTRLGSGFWVLTPLRARDGFTVLVNRGFVPPDKRDLKTRTAGLTGDAAVVSGLMRMTEPTGGFLRANNPAADRWYSRDVAAISAARQITPAAPYFIDADATPVPGGLPVGGLTVIELPNNHLVYALTWFALALMLAGAVVYIGREEWRIRDVARGETVASDG
jgi:surfeit locus 1 family protein